MEINTKNLNLIKKGNVVYFAFPHFEKYSFVKHGFTSRLGGVSEGIFQSMNLNFSVGDKKEHVIENYKIISDALDIEFKNLVLSSQTHDAKIISVNKQDRGKGIIRERDYYGIDGLLTDDPQVALVTLYADCVPIFFLDPIKRVVGLAHAGWKGTVKGIGPNMVKRFVDIYGSDKNDILVGIGPSIGNCCFEVEQDVVDEFQKISIGSKCLEWKGNNKYMIDLWKANSELLLKEGINSNNLVVTDICTKCNKDILFSHRGHDGKRGGMAAIIQLE